MNFFGVLSLVAALLPVTYTELKGMTKRRQVAALQSRRTYGR
jgi:hypothetical protein